MNYEVKMVRQMIADGVIPQEVVEKYFPELKESEDERIRKDLLGYLHTLPNHFSHNGSLVTEWIAWLEKQGEQKPNPYSGTSFEYNGHTWGMCARDNGVEILLDGELKAFLSLEKSFIYPIHPQPELAPKSALEAAKEEKVENQNCVKPVDKVEPKFKVGDYVKNVNDKREPIYEIVYMDKECYICKSDDASLGDKAVMHFTFDNPYLRLVEQKPVRQQCADFYNKNGELQMPRLTAFENELANILFDREYDGSTETEDDIQRGKLDYELAAIRLAPKLQSLINIAQKPAWSEEDEEMFKYTINLLNYNLGCRKWIKSLKFRLLSPFIREFDKEEGNVIDHLIAICDDAMCYKTFAGCYDIEKCKRFLTNLKFGIDPQKKQWKPSDEQMKVLDVAIKNSHLTTAEYDGLVKLREQLKKL